MIDSLNLRLLFADIPITDVEQHRIKQKHEHKFKSTEEYGKKFVWPGQVEEIMKHINHIIRYRCRVTNLIPHNYAVDRYHYTILIGRIFLMVETFVACAKVLSTSRL